MVYFWNQGVFKLNFWGVQEKCGFQWTSHVSYHRQRTQNFPTIPITQTKQTKTVKNPFLISHQISKCISRNLHIFSVLTRGNHSTFTICRYFISFTQRYSFKEDTWIIKRNHFFYRERQCAFAFTFSLFFTSFKLNFILNWTFFRVNDMRPFYINMLLFYA
jgi:hypothetical protein